MLKLKKPITRYDVLFTVFVLGWTLLATVASQYLITYPLYWILGEKILEPGWTLLYYILTYLVTLSMLIFLPPAIIKKYRKSHSHEPKKPTAKAVAASVDTKKINASKKDETSKTSPIDNLAKDLKPTPNAMGVQHLPTFVDIGLAPIGYVIYVFIASVLTNMMSAFAWFDVDQAQNVGFSHYITGLDRIFAMLAVVIIAPIAEELIMRGWLYGKVRRKWSAPVAILLVSLVFAVLHGQWNVGVSVFALSIVLCTMREITGTIWSGMLLHMLSNAVAFYMLYIAI